MNRERRSGESTLAQCSVLISPSAAKTSRRGVVEPRPQDPACAYAGDGEGVRRHAGRVDVGQTDARYDAAPPGPSAVAVRADAGSSGGNDRHDRIATVQLQPR